jgi:hypothetical protein
MVSLGVSRAFTRALAFWRRASRAWLSPSATEVPREPISVDKPGTLFRSVAVRATDISAVVSPLSMLPMVKLMEYPVNEYADNLWFFVKWEGFWTEVWLIYTGLQAGIIYKEKGDHQPMSGKGTL